MLHLCAINNFVTECHSIQIRDSSSRTLATGRNDETSGGKALFRIDYGTRRSDISFSRLSDTTCTAVSFLHTGWNSARNNDCERANSASSYFRRVRQKTRKIEEEEEEDREGDFLVEEKMDEIMFHVGTLRGGSGGLLL